MQENYSHFLFTIAILFLLVGNSLAALLKLLLIVVASVAVDVAGVTAL